MSARVSGDTTVSTSKDEGTGGDWVLISLLRDSLLGPVASVRT